MVTDFRRVVEALVGEPVDFVIIDGLTGNPRPTSSDACAPARQEDGRSAPLDLARS